MPFFDRAVALVLEEEKGLADDPHDPGGATNYGISLVFAGSINLDLDGDGRTTKADIIALTPEHAVPLYREHFWLPLQCERLPDPLALVLFDGAVNQGRKATARLLQRATGVADDGAIGPITVHAVTEIWLRPGCARALLADFIGARGKRYGKTSGFERFGTGWMRRLARMSIEAGALLGTEGLPCGRSDKVNRRRT